MVERGIWSWNRVAALMALSAVFFAALPGALGQNLLAPKELKEAARAVLKKEESSVVWATAKVRLRSREDGVALPGQEGTFAVLGTVVGESGLTVVSNAKFQPSQALEVDLAVVEEEGLVPEFSFVELVLSNGVRVPRECRLPGRGARPRLSQTGRQYREAARGEISAGGHGIGSCA